MADNIKAAVLTLAVNKIKQVKTPILDRVFGKKKRSLTSTILIKVRKSAETIMKSIPITAEAQVRNLAKVVEMTVPAPRFAEKILVSAADLETIDAKSIGVQQTLLKEVVAGEQADMKNSFDLTREFMAIKALSGVVVDESGTALVDYGFPAELKPVLTGTDLWTDDNVDIIKSIKAMKKSIVKNSGATITEWVAWAGDDVLAAMAKNPTIVELAKSQLGADIVEKGHLSRLAKVEINEYDGMYEDKDGNVQELIPDDIFVLVGVTADGAVEAYAPVVDLDAPGGVGKGKEPQLFFSKMWDEKDPSGKWIKVEGRPLPVLGRMISCWAKVVG